MSGNEDYECVMYREYPYPSLFAWCRTHDETFPIGAVCSVEVFRQQGLAIAAHVHGDSEAERRALDILALDERARARSQS